MNWTHLNRKFLYWAAAVFTLAAVAFIILGMTVKPSIQNWLNSSLVFAQFTDTHIENTVQKDDFGRNSLERYPLLIDHLNGENIDFALDTGDITNADMKPEQEIEHLQEWRDLIKQADFTYYPVNGNHDNHLNDSSNWQLYAKKPRIYYHDIEGIRFVFAAPEEWNKGGHAIPIFSAAQIDMIGDLINVSSTVVFATHTPLSYIEQTSQTLATQILDNVTLYICGHMHMLQAPIQHYRMIEVWCPSMLPYGSYGAGYAITNYSIPHLRYGIYSDNIAIDFVNADDGEILHSYEFTVETTFQEADLDLYIGIIITLVIAVILAIVVLLRKLIKRNKKLAS